MNKIIISINTANSAFEGNEGKEVARILRELADKLEHGGQPSSVRDINGNKVGTVDIIEKLEM